MPTQEKAEAVAELTELFDRSSAAVLTEYRGLTVSQLTRLRRALGDDATYAVVKNTLTRIAAKQAGIEGLDESLAGPTAIAFITGDPVAAAKGLRDFGRDAPELVVKGGLLEGRPIDAEGIKQLADVEPREVLLAKLAGAMKAPMAKAASLANAPLAQAARAVDALRAKRAEESGEAA